MTAAAPDALAERLTRELGGQAVERAAEEIDGVPLTLRLVPPSGEALAGAIRLLGEAGAAAIVRGSGSRQGLGNPPRGACCVLSTQALAGLDTFEPEEGVLHAGAGTPLGALREAARAERWDVPLESFGDDATLGGALAAASLGPRALGMGPARDAVLGLEVAQGTGERTRCGGRVVKNVTGYDLAKLHVGALGTLGVIEGAWLRLRPMPERTIEIVGRTQATLEAANQVALEAGRRATARCAALVRGAAAKSLHAGVGDGELVLVAELAGDDDAVEHDLAWLREVWRGGELAIETTAMERLAALQAAETAGLRARLATLPSRVSACAAGLGDALQCWHPALGLLFAGDAPLGRDETNEDPKPLLAVIDEAVRAAGAEVLFERLPLDCKATRDVFGAPGASHRLMTALKERFDPAGVLNPGRFLGRL